MKAEELMYGDLVIATAIDYDENNDEEIHEDHYARVTGISPDRLLWIDNRDCCYNLDILDKSDVDEFDKISPIPLTAEILEQNEFDEKQSCWLISKVTYAILITWLGSDGFRVKVDTNLGNVNIICKYIHELQHALRLCGLTNFANNLKIK